MHYITQHKKNSISILQLSCSVEKVAWAQNQSIVSWAEPSSWSRCRDQEQLLQNHTVKETPAHTINNFDVRSNKLYCFICTQKLKLSNWIPVQGPPIFLCQSLDLRLILSLKLFSRWMELPYIWPERGWDFFHRLRDLSMCMHKRLMQIKGKERYENTDPDAQKLCGHSRQGDVNRSINNRIWHQIRNVAILRHLTIIKHRRCVVLQRERKKKQNKTKTNNQLCLKT